MITKISENNAKRLTGKMDDPFEVDVRELKSSGLGKEDTPGTIFPSTPICTVAMPTIYTLTTTIMPAPAPTILTITATTIIF